MLWSLLQVWGSCGSEVLRPGSCWGEVVDVDGGWGFELSVFSVWLLHVCDLVCMLWSLGSGVGELWLKC